MIPAFGIGAASVAIAAAAALVVVATVPAHLTYHPTVWIDQPVAGETLPFTQDFYIKLHASAKANVTQFRVSFKLEGKPDGSADSTGTKNTSVTLQHVLATGAVHWDPQDPGNYTLTPSFLSAGTWNTGLPVLVDVVNDPPGVTVPAATPTPTPTPTVVLPTVPPIAPPAPSAPPVPTQSPSATPRPTPTAGTVSRRANGQNDLLTADGFAPVTASVNIQYQISLSGAAAQPTGSWTSLGCGTAFANGSDNYCQVNHNFPQTNETQTLHLRVVVTLGSQQSIAYGSSWVIAPLIH